MKSDKSRDTFLPEKHLSSVRLQQGRVLTDADWNEQVDIQRHLDEVSNRDIIGPTGVPFVLGLDAANDEDGFKIDPPSGTATDIQIRHGRIYVDGILCELEATTGYTTQPDFPSPPPVSDLDEGRLIVAYLDVWLRHIGTIEDPTIREVALGGPDTATRAKTVWQVKLLETSATTSVDHETTPEWQALVAPSTGKLNARAQAPTPADTPCIVPPEAGFRRLENQLYRVEIHTAGSIGSGATGPAPTFKWSRDNGSIVARWLELIVANNKIRVELPTRDETRGFSPGQWIELSDERRDLHGEPGILVKLLDVDGDLLTFNPATASDPLGVGIAAYFPQAINPKVRRWDMKDGAITVAVPTTNDGYIELEDGVEVRFEQDPDAANPNVATFHVGDFWMIPARTITGDILWPRTQSGSTITPVAQKPAGIRHHFTCLASFFLPGFTQLVDCRKKFHPLTDLPGGTPTDLPHPGQYRYYLVDGNLTPTPTGVVGINDDPNVAFAAARPFPNITAVTSIFPRDGFDSIAVILIKALASGGTYDNLHLSGVHGYRKILIRGSDLTNSAADKLSCGAIRLAAFPDGIALVNRIGNESVNVARTASLLPAESTLVGWRAHFAPAGTTLGDTSSMVLGASNNDPNGLLELTTLEALNARSGDVIFLEQPGVKVADVDLDITTTGRDGTSVIGLAADNMNANLNGNGVIGFCTVPTFEANNFGNLAITNVYSAEVSGGGSVGFGIRTETLSAFTGDALRLSGCFISTDTIDVQNVADLIISESHIRNSFITECPRFSIGFLSPGQFGLPRLVRLGGVSGDGGLTIADSNGQLIGVRLDSNGALGRRFIHFAGTGQSLKFFDTVMTTPTEVFLDLTQANGSEIVLDGFAPDSHNLPFINISGAIRLPGQGFAGLGQNGTSPWQPLELNATDIVDSRNNHIQGPAGSLQPKALGLRSSVVLAAYSVTLFDGTGVPGRQRVVPATANTALIANRIAGVCQQRLPGNTDDVSMHVTNGYTLVRVANPVANTDLPVPVFLTTVATQAGAVTSIAPTDPDSQQVRVGVLVQVFPSSQIEQYGLMRLELEKLR